MYKQYDFGISRDHTLRFSITISRFKALQGLPSFYWQHSLPMLGRI
jgi:hypothetical protein